MTLITRLLAPRLLNLFAFLACVVAMAGALYLEHVEGLDPCPLCIFQRVGVIVAGLFFLLRIQSFNGGAKPCFLRETKSAPRRGANACFRMRLPSMALSL